MIPLVPKMFPTTSTLSEPSLINPSPSDTPLEIIVCVTPGMLPTPLREPPITEPADPITPPTS